MPDAASRKGSPKAAAMASSTLVSRGGAPPKEGRAATEKRAVAACPILHIGVLFVDVVEVS